MSRHEIPCWIKNRVCFVGWDAPLDSYFGQVFVDDQFAETDEEECVYWVGADRYGEIQTTGLLAALMADYAELSEEIIETLRQDRLGRRMGPVPQRVAPQS